MVDADVKLVRKLLDGKGIPFTIEGGTRHRQLRINGQLVTILPRTPGRDQGRANRNVEACIKRFLRNMESQG